MIPYLWTVYEAECYDEKECQTFLERQTFRPTKNGVWSVRIYSKKLATTREWGLFVVYCVLDILLNFVNARRDYSTYKHQAHVRCIPAVQENVMDYIKHANQSPICAIGPVKTAYELINLK